VGVRASIAKRVDTGSTESTRPFCQLLDNFYVSLSEFYCLQLVRCDKKLGSRAVRVNIDDAVCWRNEPMFKRDYHFHDGRETTGRLAMTEICFHLLI
jgi:hypothetical protein